MGMWWIYFQVLAYIRYAIGGLLRVIADQVRGVRVRCYWWNVRRH